MPRKPTGKRSTASDGTVRVHGKAGNGEGSVYFAADGRRTAFPVSRGRAVSARRLERKPSPSARSCSKNSRGCRLTPRRCRDGPRSASWPSGGSRTCSATKCEPRPGPKAEDRVRRIVATLGSIEVGKLHVEQVVTWQSLLLKTLAPKTVGHHRQTLAQVMDHVVDQLLDEQHPDCPRTSAD